MDVPACPGCRERDARLAALERRVAALETLVRDLTARLATNSSNSSVPPSANPLDAPKPVLKQKSPRRRGGQPGHPPHLQELLPPERVHHVVPHLPAQCRRCSAPLPAEPSPGDGGPEAWIGRQGGQIVKKVFAAWHAFREGRLTRAQLPAELSGVMGQLNRLLIKGWIGHEETPAGTCCANHLEVEAALWTFPRVEGVEPTNNFLESLPRRAVLWRRRSFGSVSAAGCRFVERILTVVQTLRLQGKCVVDYLQEAVRAAQTGESCPKLLPTG